MLKWPEQTGIILTDGFSMWPTAAVSGFYFGHPQCEYFGVARIGRDQLEEYAVRRDVELSVAERWLRPNLNCTECGIFSGLGAGGAVNHSNLGHMAWSDAIISPVASAQQIGGAHV